MQPSSTRPHAGENAARAARSDHGAPAGEDAGQLLLEFELFEGPSHEQST